MHVFALAVPIDEAEAAFAHQIGERRPRRKMKIGEMGEDKHRGIMQRELCAHYDLVVGS